MSDSTASLRRRISSAEDLQSVVRTMKALAASSIGQYEASVVALSGYYRTVELGLGACFRERLPSSLPAVNPSAKVEAEVNAIVFGSDQGLVGQFNDVVADFAIHYLAGISGTPQVWCVGERVQSRIADAGLSVTGAHLVPSSVQAITPLVGQIQVNVEEDLAKTGGSHVFVFHNRPTVSGGYEPIGQQLLPLDAEWEQGLAKIPWPTGNLPEVMGGTGAALPSLIREYLFISVFRACAESLASENASRLAAMERADRNIDESLDDLHSAFHRLRQGGIDEELFDVVSGFEALSKGNGNRK
jgi:F-type H+-transporting ATPase subunit gamma